MSRDRTVAGNGTAVLTGDVDEDNDSFTIHGVAIGSGDVTVGSSGVKKVWPEDELESATSTLEGKPLVKDHENSVDGVIGRVTKTKFKPGTGILYEAEISEQFAEVAQKIADGLLEVSVRAYHAPTEELEEDDESEAKVVEDIVFDNMAVVPQGAAPSNTAQFGTAAAMGQTHPEMSADELREEFGHNDEELGLHVVRLFGHIPLNPDFVNESSVDDVIADLESHEAVNVVVSEDDDNLLLIIDTAMVDSNDDLDQHIVESLDDTPWEVFEEWNWLDRVNETFESGAEIDVVEEQLNIVPEELATINGLDINGTVMWGEDNMGVIAGFEEDGDTVMVEIDVMEKAEDGPFRKTGETVTRPLNDVDMDEETEDMTKVTRHSRLTEWSTEELQELSTHEPDWSGTTESSWSEPAMEDFETEDLSEIDDHFLVSKSGFPPENFTDLALPVVEPNGDLNLNALQNAKARAGQVEGLSGDNLDSVENMINRLANENYEDANFGDEEEESEAGSEQDSTETLSNYIAANIVDDSSEEDNTGTSDGGTISQNQTMNISYHDVDGDELEDGHVVVDQDELQSVVDKAERADKLDSRLDDMNDTLETLSEKTDILDEVDEDELEALRDREDPVVKEREQYEAEMEQVEEIGRIFAELLEEAGSPFDAEELAERFSPLELKAKYEEELGEDESLVDQLSGSDPEPEGGDANSDELGKNEEEAETEAKREAFKQRLADELEANGKSTQAEEVRSGKSPQMVDEFAEKLGADL